MNVSALEKSSGKEQKITITNDKGRLSQDESERMVQEEEKYKAEDDANKNRTKAKNGLENYCYSLKSSMSQFGAKISGDDKTKLEKAIEERISWLDGNVAAEKEEFEEKQKALEAVTLPILQATSGGGGGSPEGMPDMGGGAGGPPPSADPEGGPTIEEID